MKQSRRGLGVKIYTSSFARAPSMLCCTLTVLVRDFRALNVNIM